MKVITAYLMLIFGLGLNYIFSVLVARQFGVDVFGDYSYSLYLFNIIALIAVAGLDEASIKFIPQNKDSAETKSSIQFLSLITSIIFFGIYLGLIMTALDGPQMQMSYVLLCCLPIFVLLTVNTSILQADYIVGPRMAFRHGLEPVVKMLSFFVLVLLAVGIEAPVYAMLIALSATLLSMILIYKRRLLFYGMQLSVKGTKDILQFVLPMILNNIINVAASRMDVIVLGIVATSTQVGYYSAAFQTAAILSIVLQGLETVYAPLYSKSIGESNIAELNKNLKQSLRWTMLIASPLLLLFFLYPELALLPFGNNFAQSMDVFLVLCIGQLINLATGSANTVLLSLGKTKVVLFNSIITGLLLVIGVYFGSLHFMSIGAATAVAVAIFVMNSLRLYFLYLYLRITPFDRKYFILMLLLLLAFVIGLLTKDYINIILGVIFYPTLLYIMVLLLGMHDDDKTILLNLLKKLRGAIR